LSAEDSTPARVSINAACVRISSASRNEVRFFPMFPTSASELPVKSATLLDAL
jgi:hypothetical protein